MKKIIFACMIFSMALFLSACSNQKTVENKNNNDVSPVVEQKQDVERKQNIEQGVAQDIKVNLPADDIFCKENSKYFAIIKRSKPGVSDFLIKNKTNSNESISCSYAVDKIDFEIKEQEAIYFLTLTDNFLVLDMGTGPQRTLVVYNLNNRKKVFTGDYSNPISASGDVLKYWSNTTQKVTIDNCPELNINTGRGLGSVIQAYVSLDLSSPIKKELGDFRCSATQ